MDGVRDRGRDQRKWSDDEYEGERRGRTQSFGGGEPRKRRVSFADETEDEERLRLLQTGLSSYARHNSTHYSSKEILLTPSSPKQNTRVTSPRREEESGGGAGGVRRGDKLERVWSINGRKVERTNMRLKPIGVDGTTGKPAAATVCFSADDDDDDDDDRKLTRYVPEPDNSGEPLNMDKMAKMVVNSRRQYKVLLPTGNPNVTISVRSNGGDEDEGAGWSNPGGKDDSQHLQRYRRSLQEPLKDAHLDSTLRNATSCSHVLSERARSLSRSSSNAAENHRGKEKFPPISVLDDDSDEEPSYQKRTGHPSFYQDLGRNVYNTDNTGETCYYPIQDNGLKLVETTPTRLVSLLRPLFELKQEKMHSLTRKNKRKLRRCVSLGRYRMKGEKEEEGDDDDDGSQNKAVIRSKFYELRRNGWMNGRLNGTVAKKGTLQLDKEIDKITEKYTTAVLSVGKVLLAF